MNGQEKIFISCLILQNWKQKWKNSQQEENVSEKKLNEIGHEFRDFIVSGSVSELVKKKLVEEWVKHTTESDIKIDAIWQKKIKGKKETFQRNKAQKNSHTGHHNTDNCLRTK